MNECLRKFEKLVTKQLTILCGMAFWFWGVSGIVMGIENINIEGIIGVLLGVFGSAILMHLTIRDMEKSEEEEGVNDKE